jgi:hypothetical protein
MPQGSVHQQRARPFGVVGVARGRCPASPVVLVVQLRQKVDEHTLHTCAEDSFALGTVVILAVHRHPPSPSTVVILVIRIVLSSPVVLVILIATVTVVIPVVILCTHVVVRVATVVVSRGVRDRGSVVFIACGLEA